MQSVSNVHSSKWKRNHDCSIVTIPKLKCNYRWHKRLWWKLPSKKMKLPLLGLQRGTDSCDLTDKWYGYYDRTKSKEDGRRVKEDKCESDNALKRGESDPEERPWMVNDWPANVWERSCAEDERMRLIAGFLCFFLLILTGGTVSYIYIMWGRATIIHAMAIIIIIIIVIIITIIIIIVITPICLVPSKVDKLLASSWCDGERAHVQTGDDDDDINHQNQCFISYSFYRGKMTSMKMTAMTKMVTMEKLKLEIKRCSEWKGIRAGTFYTGTRGKKMLWSQFLSPWP